jgi:hypothetical protein
MDFLSMVFVKGDLGGAAMMVIRFVLEAVGVDVDQFFRILGKAASSIDEIIMHPVEFMTNLFGAIKNGLGRFLSNIGKHLINGLLGWLLGPLQDLGITPPKELTLSAILDLALQVIGISKDKILAKVEKAVPGAKRVIDEAWRWISALIQGGLGGLWEEIKSRLSDLWETVIGGLTQWITVELVEAGIAKLILMSNPAGAIIEAIRTIYTTLTFFVEKINQIMALVESVLNSLGKIVKGDIASAAAWIEDAMARTVPTVIAFFADWLGFDDPAAHIRKIVLKIQAKVDTALDWLVGKAVRIGKKVLGVFGGDKSNKPGSDKGPNINLAVPLDMHGEGHTIYTEVRNGRLVVEIASSQRDDLLALTARAMGQTDNKVASTRLEGVYSKLKSAEEKVTFLISDRAKDAEALALADKMTQDAANQLKSIGVEFGIPSLLVLPHKSKYVEATVTGYRIKSEYQTEIRDRFYPSSYEPATRDWKRDFLNANTDPKNSQNFIDYMGRSEPKSTATIDHQPRVVEHWEDNGKNTTQSARATWYSAHASGHLRVIAGKYNSSDGAEARNLGLRYSPEKIGKGFLGPGEN